MPLKCQSHRLLRPSTAEIAKTIVKPVDGFVPEAGQPFLCELDDSPHDFHIAFLGDSILDPQKEVFFYWSAVDDEQRVVTEKPCLKKDEGEEACALISEHPGVCDWGYIDPGVVAYQALLDQESAYLRDYGLPPVREREEDATDGG
ncbi:hypothetical protein [Streptomyces misionensis]|uniref:hypothetical protein n=1 Tax=Streptomyces misionensis TaxID=67331 RepID=UPI0036838FA2